jgi:hypothetical protein
VGFFSQQRPTFHVSERKKAGTVGRPALGRSEVIKVSFTPDEYAEVMIAAAKRGLRIPNYVRTRLGIEP